MKKGYHYTSKENWEKIQRDGGMKKYLIRRDVMDRFFPEGVNGVWLWPKDPKGVSHAGNILYQVSSKGSPEIVKLEVSYNPSDLVRHQGQQIQITHTANVGKLIYHNGERGLIITEDIPLQNIRIVGSYNTVQRLQ